MTTKFQRTSYWFFASLLLIILSAPGYLAAQCVDPPSGLVSWWTGDNNTIDLIGDNNATLQNGATFALGKVGPAFLLNTPSAYIGVPHNASLMPTTGITVDAWINRSRANGSFDPIVKKSGEGLSQANGYALEYYGNNVIFWVFINGGWKSSPFIGTTNGQWNHVTGTYDGMYIRLYVNGTEVSTGNYFAGAIVPSSNDLNIGRDPSNPSTRFFSGLIDEVEIFNRALTAQEIQEIYLAGVDGKCKQVEPIANAGEDQSVDEGTLVTLDGSRSSDPQRKPLTFSWKQIPGGPDVILSSTTDQKPSFTAPYINANVTLTFKLTVTDPDGNSSSDDVDVTVVHVNHQPVAIAAPADQNCNSPILSATIREGAHGSLSGQCSYDPDGDAITYAWTQTGGPPVQWTTNSEPSSGTPRFMAPLANAGGNLIFQLTVSDGVLNSSPSSISLALVENSAPLVNAGASQTVGENTQVALNGTAVDPDGDPIAIAWSQIAGPMTITLDNSDTLTPLFLAPWVSPGGADFTFRLTANDNYVNPKSSFADVVVHVQNSNDLPSCNLAKTNIGMLWPPNHKLIPINITNVTDPNNDSVTVNIMSITQDEYVNGLGDGDTNPDAVITDGNLMLRAERSGTGDGRIYKVVFTAADSEGSCTGSVVVSVPKDNKKPAVDSRPGVEVDSTQP